jgi:phage terminase large subunit-like protein
LASLDEAFPDRVVQFNTGSAQRMTQATVAMFEAIVDGRLSHNGDPALVRHFGNAILREDNRGGSRITKNHKGSTRKIDAAVASLIAHHRAAVWREVEAPAEPQLLVL